MRFITEKGHKRLLIYLLVWFILPGKQVFAEKGGEWVRVINLGGTWKFSIGDDARWAMSGWDDTHWENIQVPATWEDEGFYGYDGFAWYRKSFDASEIKPSTAFYLGLGYIDDADEVYFNGKLIGFSGGFPPGFHTAYKAKRMYPIPADYINWKGKNTISVRVYDTHLEGGIISGDIGIFYKRNEWPLDIDLKGVWKFREGNHPNWAGEKYDDQAWKPIMVPLAWEQQGHEYYDGIAWYRKAFFVPKSMEGADCVLLLGKIDDFDLTYLNGVFMGSTNDGRRFGATNSWLKLRMYNIPAQALRFGEVNYLAVQVKDIGIDGGIYAGPVGIITREHLRESGILGN
jgi:hypothetical protein